MPTIGTTQNFKLRLSHFVCSELYQSAYGIVLALSIAVFKADWLRVYVRILSNV
jgi:hypothetical protein